MRLDPSLRSSEVLDLLNEIEQRHVVGEWVVDGVRIWPLLRVRLYTDIVGAALLDGRVFTAQERARGRLLRMAQSLLRVGWACLADWRQNAPSRQRVDAIFLSDGVSFAQMDGRWFERFYDPMIRWLGEHRCSSLLLTPMTKAHYPRWSPSRFIQPAIDLVKIRDALRPRQPHIVRLDGLGELQAELGRQGLAAMTPGDTELLALCSRLFALADYFQGALEKSAARRAFVNTFYSLEGMAFVLAARRQGIRVADVQHGVQGAEHVAYGRWSRLPETGYELLPHEFWVWGEDERRAIEAWASRSQVHRVVVAGNPWLQLWESQDDPAVAVSMGAAKSLRGQDGRKRALVTFQWGISLEEYRRMLRAAAASLDTVWWLRLHPLVYEERGAIARLAEECGVRAYEIDVPTRLPLPALLRMADVHVTHSSTAVIEAEQYGVRSIITSEYGAQFFQREIAAGNAVVATSEGAISKAVAELQRFPASTRVTAQLPAAMHEAFQAAHCPGTVLDAVHR